MATIPRESKTNKARRAMVNRVAEIPTRDWAVLPIYTDMAVFMKELVDGAFDHGDEGPEMEMTNLYWNPSVNLDYACDNEQDPVTSYFGRDESSRGPHDVVAVRECNSRWVGQLRITDFKDSVGCPEGCRRFQVVNLAGDEVFQVWIHQNGENFYASQLATMVMTHLIGSSSNLNAGTKIVFVFDDNIIDIDADLLMLPGANSLNRNSVASLGDIFSPRVV